MKEIGGCAIKKIKYVFSIHRPPNAFLNRYLYKINNSKHRLKLTEHDGCDALPLARPEIEVVSMFCMPTAMSVKVNFVP